MYGYQVCAWGWRRPEEDTESLELELQILVGCQVGPGN